MKNVFLIGMLLSSFTGFAQNFDPYFQIKQVRVKEVNTATEASPLLLKASSQKSMQNWGQILLEAKNIIAFGEAVYKIIKENKPELHENYTPISVLPKTAQGGVPDFTEMESWKGPKVQHYEVVMENMLGLDVVTFKYLLHFYYQGTYQGSGNFIKGLIVIPEYVNVLPGFALDANFGLVDMVNLGTTASPLPSISATLRMKIDGPLDITELVHTYQVIGDGRVIRK
jgi:hypothetical protein